MNNKNFIIRFSDLVGPLRVMLYIFVAILVLMAFFSMGEMHYSGLMMFPTLIAPVMVPMLFFAFPLDMTMCAIMMSSKGSEARSRYKTVILIDLLMLVVLVVVWLPYYKRLLN